MFLMQVTMLLSYSLKCFPDSEATKKTCLWTTAIIKGALPLHFSEEFANLEKCNSLSIMMDESKTK